VNLLEPIAEVEVVGVIEHDELSRRPGPLEHPPDARERRQRVAPGGEVECGNIAVPVERDPHANEARKRVGSARRSHRHDGPDATIASGERDHRPAAEAVPHGGDTLAVDRRLEVAEASVEEAIEDEPQVGGTIGDPSRHVVCGEGITAAVRRATSTRSAAVFPVWSGAATT
jgi:hypothetical protein